MRRRGGEDEGGVEDDGGRTLASSFAAFSTPRRAFPQRLAEDGEPHEEGARESGVQATVGGGARGRVSKSRRVKLRRR